jgi:putative SOS response-associated peptidase YedK
MCGRFSLDRKPKELEVRFKARLNVQGNFPLFNIAPTMKTACVCSQSPSIIQVLEWGLAGKGKDGKSRSLINARSETLTEKWPFRDLVKANRCLVLASGYIEWKTFGTVKIPHLHQLAGGALFAMAGVYESNPNEKESDSISERFSILTKASSGPASTIHDRMPVILKPSEEAVWLESDEILSEISQQEREPDQLIRVFPISPKLNTSFENDSSLMVRTPYTVAEQLKLF